MQSIHLEISIFALNDSENKEDVVKQFRYRYGIARSL